MKILLIDGARGQYVPQAFAQQTPREWLSGCKEADFSALLSGPDHADYWEAWEDVLNHATLTFQGKKFYLWQDGDLWAIPEGESPED